MSAVPDSASASAGAHRDFLVEVGTEELPPKALRELEMAFAESIESQLKQFGLNIQRLESFSTPRRLAVLVRKLAARQPDQAVTRRGPPLRAAVDAAGQPTRAATAFAESCGVSFEKLGRETDAKGNEYLSFSGVKQGVATVELLPAIVQVALDALPIPKRMRWGAGEAQFVRPVHWLVLMFGKEVLRARLLDTAAGNATRGHRFMAPKAISLSSPASYERALLTRGKVIASFAARREQLREQVNNAAITLGGRALLSDALLDEVTSLVEWPVPVAGQFEERFLQLPREVLISTLQHHQRYFPVQNEDGALLPWFITVSNIQSSDPGVVRAGNERVVRPRLTDAAFFYEQDRRQPLAARRPGLDAVTFQVKLGSVGDKVRRVASLTREIAPIVGADVGQAVQAAELCKCDLLSSMVGEFPELQGIMGRYYALADGLPGDVAGAIREHYLPRGAGDELPQTRVGIAVALADKLDTLAGIFAIGQKPTGTRDPFALRRAAIGVLRILQEHRLPLDLRAILGQAIAQQPVQDTAAATSVYDFVIERLRAQYLEQGETNGVTTERFDAVVASNATTVPDFDARLRALVEFLKLPAAASLAAANKRSANILKKSTEAGSVPVSTESLRLPAEIELHQSILAAQPEIAAAIKRADYVATFNRLAALRPAVDAFFDAVMVNDPDPALRINRLALLGQLRQLFTQVADLSLLPG
jgi:glycyl-tRNA synthetase beta chain